MTARENATSVLGPCGYILHKRPLYLSESIRQTVEAFEEYFPTLESKPSYVWLDKACQYWYSIQSNQAVYQTWKNTTSFVELANVRV